MKWLSAICLVVLAVPSQAQNPFTITTASPLPGATVQVSYSQGFASSGGAGAVTWSVSAGTPPPGLAVSSGGSLSGTPTQAGWSSFTVTALDQRGSSTSKPF